MNNYESQVGKCVHCQEWNTFPFGACILELLEWGFPYGCNGRGEKCPDFKKMEELTMRTEELTYTIMLATKGGMLISDNVREVYPTDGEMATELGRAIIGAIESACKDTADVAIKIEFKGE